jgi:hypothetical protein
MVEVLTPQLDIKALESQILSEFLATLNKDKIYDKQALWNAAQTFAPMPELVLTSVEPELPITKELPVVPRLSDSVLAEPIEVVEQPKLTRERKPHRGMQRAKKTGSYVLAAATVVLGVNAFDSLKQRFDGDAAEQAVSATPAIDQASETTLLSITVPESPARTTVPEVVVTLAAPESVTTEAATTTEVATTTTESTTTTEAPTTTTEAPRPLSLTEQVMADPSLLMQRRGLKLGELSLDVFCDTVDIYIENPIDFDNPANIPYLSAEAQAKVAELANPSLTRRERLMLEDDIMQKGLPDGSGSPMYALQPERPDNPNCAPMLPNPRDGQHAYGSTEATANGGVAGQYQAIADLLPEFAAIPGGGSVTYIQGHRSSQSAAFNGLHQYEIGNTVTYMGDDGQVRKYRMVGRETIDGDITLDQLAQQLRTEAASKEWLVLQVCIDGQPDNRALFIFEPDAT